MNEPRPVKHISAEIIEGFYQTFRPRQGSYVVEGSKRLHKDGFPARFVQDFNVDHCLAELHLHEDDLISCIDGSTYFVVGGRLVDPWTKDELTFFADKIEGGREITLNEGDWLHIPAGQPHTHFTPNNCRLMAVKVALPAGVEPFSNLQELQK